ncbi:MAG: 2-hydroxyacid dehydrogenase [Alphaproteobacteria bacterium]|nr:2-hydroxyacid dehydrogenase [Alphaproteobacteria bacterium]MCL2504945.1 2-hydroxyacid dehydrogenase [Alphaproteobacteria bacterium]
MSGRRKIKLHISSLSQLSPDALALVQNDRYELSFQNAMAANEEVLAASIADKDAVYLGGDDFYSEKVLQQAKNLKLLSFGGIGYATFIDAKAAKDLNITITNTPGSNSQSCAEMAVGLCLDALRKINFTNKTREKPVSHNISALKIGMIGFGNINKAIYKILRDGFNADVRYWNRTGDTTPLDTILGESDIIFITISFNDETKDFINAERIAKMKDGVILVNTARPGLINADAVLAAIKSGKVATLAQDGYYDDPRFIGLPNDRFIATPHIAAKTKEDWHKTDLMAFQNIIDFFETGTSKNIVNS